MGCMVGDVMGTLLVICFTGCVCTEYGSSVRGGNVGNVIREDLLSIFPGEDIYRVKYTVSYLVENHLDMWGYLYDGLSEESVIESLYGYDISYDVESLESDLGRGLTEFEWSSFREYYIDCMLVVLGF